MGGEDGFQMQKLQCRTTDACRLADELSPPKPHTEPPRAPQKHGAFGADLVKVPVYGQQGDSLTRLDTQSLPSTGVIYMVI